MEITSDEFLVSLDAVTQRVGVDQQFPGCRIDASAVGEVAVDGGGKAVGQVFGKRGQWDHEAPDQFLSHLSIGYDRGQHTQTRHVVRSGHPERLGGGQSPGGQVKRVLQVVELTERAEADAHCRLWASDFYTEQVIATDGHGHTETVAKVPSQPSGLGFLPDGRALIVSMRDRRLLVRDDSGHLQEHADLSGLTPWHLNDMVVDAGGRAYVGNFGFDLMGGGAIRNTSLLRADPDGTVAVVADDLAFPNGMVILGDGTLVVAETLGNRLTAFDIMEDGSLTRRRV